MPSLAEGYERKQKAIATIVAGVVAGASPDMGHRVDAAGAVEEQDRADESPPDKHLQARGAQRGIPCSQRDAQSVGKQRHEKRADQVKAVEEDEFRKFRQIRDEPVIGGEVAAAGHPADMGPPEPLLTGGVHVIILVRVSVVVAVCGSPPEGSALDAQQADQCHRELHGTPRAVRFVTEIAVVDPGDKEHPHQVEQCADTHGHGAPTGPDHSEATEMKDDEGDGLAPLETFRQGPRGLWAERKMIRVNQADY